MIDTNIIIYSLKNNESVNEKFRTLKDTPKSLSVITYGELIYGAKKSRNIDKNLATTHRVSELFPIINISPAIMETFGELKASLEKKVKLLTIWIYS